eukprot:Sspe_Gene.113000::Locus_96862_Transcript_1_1_Confidence_1.000_Length_1055::g.113000::m.113000/K00799/GST, gst; glutathione S-transferase
MENKPRLAEAIPFVNLPYLIDGDLRMSQSNSILRHLARRYDLMGPNPSLTDLVLDAVTDIDTGLIWHAQKASTIRAWRKDKGRPALEMLSKNLRASYFASSDSPTVADFKTYELLHKIRQAMPEETATFPNLLAFSSRIESLPAVSKFLSLRRNSSLPFFNPHVAFGGTGPQ